MSGAVSAGGTSPSTRPHIVFCSFTWPLFPGLSGGDIRDYYLLRQLLRISDVEFFALGTGPSARGHRSFDTEVVALHTADTISRHSPELIDESWLGLSTGPRPVPGLGRLAPTCFGRRYHHDVMEMIGYVGTHLVRAVQRRLDENPPEFLFVSPQSNPLALMLDTRGLETRTILASYDVEAVRLERLAASRSGWSLAQALEARRATRFERDNVAAYDGVIAVSDLDREEFIRRYELAENRVIAIENGIDLDYHDRQDDGAASRDTASHDPADRIGGEKAGAQVVFVSSLAYEPNRQAAWRLIEGIMPRVREHYPDAGVAIVGQQPGERLRHAADGERVIVTGTVDDVRPWLRRADVACVPLIAGSGVKYKIVEAMAARVPIVCTGLSLEGMDLVPGKHALVGESDAELAEAIIRLLDDADLAARLTQAARRHVERRYDPDRELSRLQAWLLHLSDQPRLAGHHSEPHYPRRPKRPGMEPSPTPSEEAAQDGTDELPPGLERAYRHARAGEVSPRSRFGPLGVWGKKLINRLTRHQLGRQTEFNQGVIYTLHEIDQRFRQHVETTGALHGRLDELAALIGRYGRRLEEMSVTAGGHGKQLDRLTAAMNAHGEQLDGLSTTTRGHGDRLERIETSATAQGRHIDALATAAGKDRSGLADLEEKLGGEIRRLATLLERLEGSHGSAAGIDQLAFANHFRGDEEVIRKRFSKYTKFFADADRVLDVGCGRGEFLEVCSEAGINAYGIDSDVDMVGRCSIKGLPAHLGDALDHLNGLDDDSLGGLFSAQVIEHLAPGELVELIRLAALKLRPDAVIVLETINTDSFYSLRWFHADPSHRQPVPPETLKFLLTAAGFTLQEVVFSGPPPERERLQPIPEDSVPADVAGLLAAADANVRKLNDLLFGPQDYAVVGVR